MKPLILKRDDVTLSRKFCENWFLAQLLHDVRLSIVKLVLYAMHELVFTTVNEILSLDIKNVRLMSSVRPSIFTVLFIFSVL